MENYTMLHLGKSRHLLIFYELVQFHIHLPYMMFHWIYSTHFSLCVLLDSIRDYAGTSFATETCDDPGISIRNTLTVDRKTNTYSTRPLCNESTGNMATAGWYVNSIYFFEELLICGEMGQTLMGSDFDCSKGKPTVTDTRWFFGNMFRVPALQEEFWKLWDIVVKHGLVEKNGLDSSDLFSTDLFVDQLFEPIRATVKGMYRVILQYSLSFSHIHL